VVRREALEKSREFKDALRVEKAFERIMGSLGRAPACRICRERGARNIDIYCRECLKMNRTAVARTITRLSELLEDYEDLPILDRVRACLRSLRATE
jgi:hypothetical protein